MTEALFGPYGRLSADEAHLVAEADCNAAFFHGFNQELFEVCEHAGLQACVEFKTFRVKFADHPQLIPTGVDGRPIRFGQRVQGICLSQTDYLDEVESGLRQGMADFRPRGVWLDYLTYTGWFEEPQPDLQESCFCAACVEDFCQGTGVEESEPARILQLHPYLWGRHKCRRIMKFARHYADIIKRADPHCIVGAYMCPYLPHELDGALERIFAQDYALLAPHIEVFTPLIYATKAGRSSGWGREFLEASQEFVPENRSVQLILDALDFPDLVQETATASVPTRGFQLFAGAALFADPDQRRVISDAVQAIRGKLA